jgi:hypothetical protein
MFLGVIEDMNKLIARKTLSRDELGRRLRPADLAFLDETILVSKWYPMESYARLTDFLCEVEGADRRTYFRKRGATNAKRLVENGMYSQLGFLKRWDRGSGNEDVEARLDVYIRSLQRVVTLAKLIYNTADWVVERDPDRSSRARIEIPDAASYSEGMRFAIEGFFNECARSVRGTSQDLFVSERVAPSHIRISMTQSTTDLYGAGGG